MTSTFPRKFGKYQLLAPLAQGGMGALYLATSGGHDMEKLCVIKTVLPALADKEYVARFRDEAKVVVKLSHGNLVPVFDAGEVLGEMFLAMDFVEGKDLRAVWNMCAKKRVAFPIDVAVYITKELARGLGYAHTFRDLQLVHRDVSPPNVLVSFTGEVKITDFGLASSTLKAEKTAPGVIYGKVSYMSPEQARGEPLDGRSDLYAAGIILWELLTGRQLYPAGKLQPHELLQRAKEPHPEPPSRRASRVPPDLDEVVLRALTSDQTQRYQNGEEMRTALSDWLARNHPGTDSARLEKFVVDLFADSMEEERLERERMISEARQKLRAPTASGRRVDGHAPTPLAVSTDPNKRGVAVKVPAPGPGGTTVIPTSGAALAVAPQLEDPHHVIGKVLHGRYLIRKLVGVGGMGRVYEAEHTEIGRRVAVKILHPAYTRSPDVVARFRREARAASRIGHPNIVDVTDSGTTDEGGVYFVMEYLQGVDLAKVIHREGPLEIERAVNIGTQICRAVAAAHSAGIIHRDLKPENVFLVMSGGSADFVKVLDFGIAKTSELEEQRKERLTTPGMAMGTPEYMAPEQAAGKPADARTDVYSVGAIVYEMLTGKGPYTGENFMEILTKKATLEPAPLREVRDDVPPALEAVVMRAMGRDPGTRPPSMEAFEYELTKCLAGRGVAVANRLGLPMERSQGFDGATNPGLDVRRLTAQRMPLQVTGAIQAAPDISIDEPTPQRSGARWLWALVIGGVGVFALAWMGLGRGEEKPDPKPSPMAAVETPAPAPAPVPVEPPAPVEEAPVVEPDASEPTVPDVVEPVPPTNPPRDERPRKEPKPPRRTKTGPPADAGEAVAILAEARAAEARMQWGRAREAYGRISEGKFKRPDGLLGLAGVAFQTGDLDGAITLARDALAQGGGDRARMLLGHAYYKKGLYQAAINQYSAILKRNPDNKEAQQALDVAQKKQRGQ